MERLYHLANDKYNRPVVYESGSKLYYDKEHTKEVPTADMLPLFAANVVLHDGTTYKSATKCTEAGVITWAV